MWLLPDNPRQLPPPHPFASRGCWTCTRDRLTQRQEPRADQQRRIWEDMVCDDAGLVINKFSAGGAELARMPVELAMVGPKRRRKDPCDEGRSGGSGGPSKRGWGGAGDKLFFECTLCGKAVSRTDQLKEYERTHTGEFPYACATSSKAFSRSSNLTRHYCSHTGYRPYVCTTCGNNFLQSS